MMKQKIFCLLAVVITVAGCRKDENPGPPVIAGFDPQTLAPFNYITIHGSHFDTLAAKNSVNFNGQAATVFRVQGDSVLIAVVPQNVTPGKITVTANGVTVTSASAYSVLAGGWIRKTDFPDIEPPNSGRTNGIGFAIGNTGYMGLGTNNGAAFNDLYAYDPVTDKWTSKSSMPIGVEEAFSMVINGKAYVGTGNTRNGGDTKQFFEYDPSTDKWTAKADFPDIRSNVSAFGVEDKGYAGFGRHDINFYKDWWQYDPAGDSWTRKADFPGISSPYAGNGFALNGKVYIGGTSSTEWWQYDPANDTWTKKKNLTWAKNEILTGVVIDNKGYLMGPENWQYDDKTDNWTQKAFFIPRYGGSLFSIGNKGYYGTGLGWPSDFLNIDFWEYTPD